MTTCDVPRKSAQLGPKLPGQPAEVERDVLGTFASIARPEAARHPATSRGNPREVAQLGRKLPGQPAEVERDVLGTFASIARPEATRHLAASRASRNPHSAIRNPRSAIP